MFSVRQEIQENQDTRGVNKIIYSEPKGKRFGRCSGGRKNAGDPYADRAPGRVGRPRLGNFGPFNQKISDHQNADGDEDGVPFEGKGQALWFDQDPAVEEDCDA